jgi:long-subunit fatty acid transport protein
VVGGVALRRLYDFTEKQTFKASTDFEDIEYVDEYTGGINAITPAVGIQFNDMISVGAGINILTGSLEYEGTDPSGFDPEPWSVDYSGTSFDLGVLVKPNQQLSLGANFNLPYTMTWEEESYETEMNVPLFFSIGLGYRASEKLLLAADYSSRPWSSAELEEGGETYELSDMVEDANSLHFGLEYLAESGENILPLRLGFYTQPTPAMDANDDQVTLSGITAGAGLIMDKLILDGSFQYLFGSYVGDTEINEFGNDREVDYTQNDFKVTVGATLHFGE